MKKIAKIILGIVLGLFLLATLPYYQTRIYNFSEPQPFTGDAFYNPYQTLGPHWVKANFHAHSILHFGLANGDNTPEEMYAVYDSMNYDLPCISNYNSILPDTYNRKLYLSAYEHGFNGGAIHQLVLNNKEALKFDFPFWQSLHHKQTVLEQQKSKDNIIVLAHPNYKTGYSANDLAYLTHYDLFEGISARASSIDLWDAALSHGHAVWVSGNDDAHNTRFGVCGVCWNLINTDSLTTEALVDNLNKGRTYATRGWIGQEMNQLVSLSVDSNVYSLVLQQASDSIILKSDGGKTVAVATQSDRISYTIPAEDSYVRAEIFDTESWNTYTKTYLNPVIRTPDGRLRQHGNTAEVNRFKSYAWRGGLLLFHLLFIGLIYYLSLAAGKIR
jgi:hypothetical protein